MRPLGYPDGLAALGALAVAAGTYPPWIVPSPDADVVPAVYLPGMEWGLAAQDYLVLALLVVGLLAAARYREDRRGGYLAAGTGAGVAVVTVAFLAATLAGWGVFAPGPGAALTVAGALALVAAGGWHVRVVGGEEAGGAATPG